MPQFIVDLREIWVQPVVIEAADRAEALRLAQKEPINADDSLYAPVFSTFDHDTELDDSDVYELGDALPTTRVQQLLRDLRSLAPQLAADDYARLLAELTLVPALDGSLL